MKCSQMFFSETQFSISTTTNICKKTYQFKIHCKDDVMISLH